MIKGLWKGVCLAAFCILLTACGGQDSGTEISGENGTETAAGTQAAQDFPDIPSDIPEGRQVIRIGEIYEDFSLTNAVKGFNESNDTYWVEVLSYGKINGKILGTADPEAEAVMKRIQIAMTVGTDCPDLMFINPYWMNVTELVNQGYFEDLAPYLERSSRLSAEDFMEGIPEAFTYGGRLITLPCYFRLEALVGKRSQLEQFDSWTAGDLFAYGEQYPDSVLVECDSEPIYTQLIYGDLLGLYEDPPFVVEDGGRRTVDREQLAFFLEKIKKDSEKTEDFRQSSQRLDFYFYPDYYAENRILLRQTRISWFWDIQLSRALFAGDEMYVGYPSEDGRNIKITAEDIYGIPSLAKNKEGAWAFLEYYLSQPQDVQGIFPARKDAFEEALQRDLLHEGYEVNEEGILVLEGTNTPLYSGGSNGWTFSPGEIRQEDIETVKEMISRAGHSFKDNYTEIMWLKIMAEEDGAWFNGQKSLQDVADIIAGRLQMYLDESGSPGHEGVGSR